VYRDRFDEHLARAIRDAARATTPPVGLADRLLAAARSSTERSARDRSHRPRRVAPLVIAAVVLTAAVGITVAVATAKDEQPATPPAPAGSTPASTTTSRTTSGPSTTAPVEVTPTGASSSIPTGTAGDFPGACTLKELTVSVSHDAVDSVFVDYIHFTNRSTAVCTMVGYPGVAVLDRAGRQQFQALRTPRGFFGGYSGSGAPPSVTLQPGQTATSDLEGTYLDSHQAGCPTDPAVLVTPPNATTSIRLNITVSVCVAPSIHPVIAGQLGSSQ